MKIGKKLKLLFSTFCMINLPLFLSTSCNKNSPAPDPMPEWVDPEIGEHDKDGWEHAIQQIAGCQHPTIYLNTAVTQAIQQIVNLYLSSSILAQQLNHTYKEKNFKYNDNILLTPFGTTYQLKKDKSIGSFAYKYSILTDENFNFRNILKYGVDQANNMIITNLQDFDTTLKDYDTTLSNYGEFNSFSAAGEKNWIAIDKILDQIYNLYPSYIKFNFVLSDTDFWYISNNCKTNEIQLNILTKMLQRADKFYTVSEGSLTFYRLSSFKNWYVARGYIPYSKKKNIWNSIKSLPFDYAKEVVKISDVWFQFANCEKYITSFGSGNEAALTSEFLNEKRELNKWTTVKPCYPWFAISSYKKLFNENGDTYNDNFVKAFLSFYLFYESGNQQNFNDYIINTSEIKNNFDSKKKNLIFLLPSFMGRLPIEDEKPVLLEYKRCIDKIYIDYPINEWNYIYKFHPRASESLIVEALKIIFNNVLPTNTVVLKNIYPSEYLFALDSYLVNSKKESYYHLIDPTTFNDSKPSGIFTAENLMSTSVYTAMEMMSNEYGYPWQNINKLIQKDAFYLPTKYHMSTTTFGDYSQINKAELVDYFNKFYEIGHFVNPSIFEFIK